MFRIYKLDGVRTDQLGFSLCAMPLESFGPVFQDGRGDGMNERRSGVYQTRVGRGGYSGGRCFGTLEKTVV